MQKLNIVYRQIKDLKPYKKNAKKHNKEQVEQIANSIKEFGFTQPVIIDKNNCVVAGHGRILGAKKAGLKQVPTVTLEELTEEQIKAYRLVDNKLNESEWDSDLLKQSLDEIAEMDMDLFGFEIDTLQDGIIEVEPEVPFTEILNEENNYIVLKFNNKIDWLNAMGMFGIEKAKAYPTRKERNKKSFGMRAGVGRVLDGQKALERVTGNEV
jgi:site-specific DNA-methyltransferase (adenine-specific)